MGVISCYAVFGRKSKLARTAPLSNATKGMDEVGEAVGSLSKGEKMEQGAEAHVVIDCPIYDDASLNEKPRSEEGEADASGQEPEMVVDIDKLSSFSTRQHEYPLDGLNSSGHIFNMGSSCSQETGQGGVSLGEGSSSPVRLLSQQDGQGDGLSEASENQQVNMSLHTADGNSYSDYDDEVNKLEQPNARSDEVVSGHASDPGYGFKWSLVEKSPSDDKELSFVEWASPSGRDEDSSSLPLASLQATGEGVPMDEKLPGSDATNSSFSRVKEWVNSIQTGDLVFPGEEEHMSLYGNGSLTSERIQNEGEGGKMFQEHTLQTVAVRSLHPSSTVAHMSGIGLREVPPLGMFSSLRALNLSANAIVRVPIGCLPRGLHSLDLSSNKIAQIEGLRELNRLRVLNLSHNRISRIGHGLANCTLIKELYLAGNKIAEVEGLHRLLKLAVLDLSCNKIATPKGFGQLAANYGSLLGLNLLENPILTNFSEDQLRKLVKALAPHATYLNRQPIKTVSVREAALDSVARAALGTSQRSSKGKKVSGAAIGSGQKKAPPSHQHMIRQAEKKVAFCPSSGQQHRHHHQHHSRHVQASVKELGPELVGLTEELQKVSLSMGMHRSKSANILQE